MKSSMSAQGGTSASNSEWKLVNSGTRMARPLRGVELVAQHSKHHFNGNVSTELL